MKAKERTDISTLDRQENIKKIIAKTAYYVLGSIPAILAILLACYYIYGPGEGYFHSDCTDTLFWANAALEGNGIFDETFKYAALLPFSTVAIMIPLISIFGVTMTAHNIGMTIFAILFALSIYTCARSAKMSHLYSSVSVFVLFSVLSASDKLREMMWGHTIYYSLGLALMFFLLALAFKFADSVDKGKRIQIIIWGLLFAALAAGSATNGLQIIVLTTLPVAGAFFCERVFEGRDGLITRKSFSSIVTVLLVCIGTLVGLKVLGAMTGGTIQAGYANGYSTWSDLSSWLPNSEKFFTHYLTLLGVNITAGKPLFGDMIEDTIKAVIRIGIGLIILATPIVMLACYKKLRSKEVRIILWAHIIVCAVIMFGYICGKLSAANWRLTPILGSGAFLTVVGLRELVTSLNLIGKKKAPVAEEKSRDELIEIEQNSEGVETTVPTNTGTDNSGEVVLDGGAVVLSRICALILAVVIAGSLIFAKEVRDIPEDYGRDNANHLLAQFLVDNGLEYGYATFWYAQAITVLSDSAVRVRNINVKAGEGISAYHYQSSTRWYDDQEGVDEYFVILSLAEYSTASKSPKWAEWMESCYSRHYDDVNGFMIYVFTENILSEYGSLASK